MDRLNQLRGEAGGSRDSTLDTSAATSEAYMTANESSKYFSLTEEDSSFDISPIKDVSLASTADPEKAITGTDQLISTLSPNAKKNDLLDSYKFDKQIEAANILSGGVEIFDDNDNSYDGHELVIDDNVVEIDDKSNSEMKSSEGEGVSIQKNEEITESAVSEEISQPVMGAELSEPAMGDEISGPVEGEEMLQPIIGEEVSEPAMDEETSELTIEEVSEPAMGEEISESVVDEEMSQPATGEEVSEPTIGEEVSEPTIEEEVSEPVLVEDIAEPAMGEDIAEPAIDDEMSQPSMGEAEPTIVSKDTEEVVLQIDGKNVNAIDIGNGLYLYRKQGEEELAAVQIVIDDDQQQPSFKFLKVRENAEGNLEVYEEIEVEVPVKEEKPEKTDSHVPIKDTNKVISDSSSNKVAERKVTPQEDMAPESSKRESVAECSKYMLPDKPDVNINGKMVKFNETRKSPVIHSTPNKEGIPLTKTMVDQQLHPSRHSDNVKTIEVHTDSVKQRIVDVQPKNKDDDNKDSIKELGECSKKCDGTKQNKLNPNQDVKKEEKKKEESGLIMEKETNKCEETGNTQNVSGQVKFAKYPQKDNQHHSTVSSKVEATTSPQKEELVRSQQSKTKIIKPEVKINEEKEKHQKTAETTSTLKGAKDSKEMTELKTGQETDIKPLGIEENVDNKSVLLDVNVKESSNKTRDKMQPLNEITQFEVKTLIQDSGKIQNAEKSDELVPSALYTKTAKETSQYQVRDSKMILGNLLSQTQQIENKETTPSERKINKNLTPAQLTRKPVNIQTAKKVDDDQASNIKNIVKNESAATSTERKPIELHKDSLAKETEKQVEKIESHGKLQNISIYTNTLMKENLKNRSITCSEQAKNLEYRAPIPVAAKTIEESILSNIGQKEAVKPQVIVVETKTVHGKPVETQHQLNKQNETKDLDFAKGSTSLSTISLKAEVLTSTTSNQNRSVINKSDNLTQRIEVKHDSVTVPNQTSSQNKPDVKNIAQTPINNNHTAVPFGKWTPANRQEFLNKIKETKVPATSCSNTKQLKKTNDLNRRDVLQKIDSQRQSNTAAAKAQELPKSSIHSISQPNIKAEIKTFVSKQMAPCDNKVPVKAEAPLLQIKSATSKKPAKQEPLKPQTKLPIPTIAALEVPKKEISQRKEINNQDLIDRTIEGIINRAVSAKPHEVIPNLPRQPFKTQMETPTTHNLKISTEDNPVTCLDAIEKKMNELHGIPFVERPAHELPKLYNHDKVKTYARPDSQKTIPSKTNKIPNLLPFTGKTQHKIVKDSVIEVDSEEEIIEHEPVTGDIDKNNKIISKLPPKINETSSTKTATEDAKKESIITEKDFDKFARRNSKTYENCLTVNFEHKDQPNVVQTVVEKDVHHKKYSRNELLLAEAKVKSYQKQKSSQAHTHPSKIQISSKLVPVADDTFNKNFPSKLQLAYQTALTTKRQMESPITIIEDKPVKVVFMDTATEFAPARLNVQGQELSPSKKPSKEADCVTISTCDSLDSDVLDSVDALDGKVPDETKSKIKHQRKQVLTPVETPELELIEPGDLGITVSPKKRRKIEDMKIEKSPKTVVPKKSYLLGRNAPIKDTVHKDLTNNTLKETVVLASAIVTHKNTASAIDNLVLAAELLETQSEKLSSTTTKESIKITTTDSLQQNTPVKRGRGRPRKYPLPEGVQIVDKVKSPSPQKKPRLIDAMRSKRRSTSEEEDDNDTTDDEIVKENWTMGKINENIVCPICNKLFRSENVVFKHVKHCSGPSPNRSSSDKRSPRRSRMSLESESKSRESKFDDTDFEEEIPLKKNTHSKCRSDGSNSGTSTDQDDVIVIEDTPLKEKPVKRDPLNKHESRKAAKISHNVSDLSCEFCGKAFRQLSHLVNHKQQHQKEELKKLDDDTKTRDKKVFSCEICKKEFRKLHHLVQHRLIHNVNNVPHRTSRKSSFEQIDNKTLRDQESKQTDDQTAAFRCEPCDKSFRKLHHLVEHRETHDGINRQKSSTTQPTADKAVPAPPPPQCDICKKTFRKLHHLIEHKEQHIETNSEKSDDKSVKSSLSTKDIIHECSLCYMVFPNEHSLNKHTIICQRKKRQSATKETKSVEENEANEQVEEARNCEENKQIEVIEPTNTNPILQAKTENKEQELVTVETTEESKMSENRQSITDIISDEIKMQPTKRELEQPEKPNVNETILETPAKIMKVDEKEKLESENNTTSKTREVTPKKKIKDKDVSSVTKRQKLTSASLTAAHKKSPVVESSDEEEIRYMLNPAFKLENKEETFMKVRAKKRSSLQIERPNSKDREINVIKRSTSLQHPPKVARLKPKSLGNKITPLTTAPTKIISKTHKLQPASSTDSDDSDIKYSFPKTSSEPKPTDKPKQEIEKTPKEKRKLLTQKRQSLIGLAKKKAVGQMLMAKNKDSPVKQIKRRTAEVEHRCDCGQLFSSAALLSRHTTLAHTPPRIRKRRSSPPAAQPPPATKPAARKSGPTDKTKIMNSRKSSVRSDVSGSTNQTKKPVVKEKRIPARRGKASNETEAKCSTTSKPKLIAAHRGVPIPEKIKKIASKLK